MRWKSQATLGVKFNAAIVGEQGHGFVKRHALAVINAQAVRDHIGFKGAFAVVGQVLNNSVSKSAWHWMSLSVKWFVDEGCECDDDCGCDYERRCEPRCQPGHFFLRRKLPLPRPTRDG